MYIIVVYFASFTLKESFEWANPGFRKKVIKQNIVKENYFSIVEQELWKQFNFLFTQFMILFVIENTHLDPFVRYVHNFG